MNSFCILLCFSKFFSVYIPVVNFTNILQAAFVPVLFCKK